MDRNMLALQNSLNQLGAQHQQLQQAYATMMSFLIALLMEKHEGHCEISQLVLGEIQHGPYSLDSKILGALPKGTVDLICMRAGKPVNADQPAPNPALILQPHADDIPSVITRCPECQRKIGHNLDCPLIG